MNWLKRMRWWSQRQRISSRRGTSRTKLEPAQIESLEQRTLLTVAIQFDYRFDTSHFFDATDRRAALQAAGHLVADQLTDTLGVIQPSGTNRWTPNVINPATGATVSLANTTSVAANTILVFVGARNISSVGIGGPGGFSASGTTT